MCLRSSWHGEGWGLGRGMDSVAQCSDLGACDAGLWCQCLGARITAISCEAWSQTGVRPALVPRVSLQGGGGRDLRHLSCRRAANVCARNSPGCAAVGCGREVGRRVPKKVPPSRVLLLALGSGMCGDCRLRSRGPGEYTGLRALMTHSPLHHSVMLGEGVRCWWLAIFHHWQKPITDRWAHGGELLHLFQSLLMVGLRLLQRRGISLVIAPGQGCVLLSQLTAEARELDTAGALGLQLLGGAAGWLESGQCGAELHTELHPSGAPPSEAPACGRCGCCYLSSPSPRARSAVSHSACLFPSAALENRRRFQRG